MIKKYLLLAALLCVVEAFAQCPATPITLSSQAEIDAFGVMYPDCSLIEGNITISGANIVDLIGLSGISSIDGSLTIQENPMLTTLSGWEEVAFLGTSGSITIKDNALLEELTTFFGVLPNGLAIFDNPVLTDISGLSGISSIPEFGELFIVNNTSLTQLTGLENITEAYAFRLGNNPNLSSMAALNFFELNLIDIYNNDSLTTITGFENVTTEMFGFFIGDNESVTDVQIPTAIIEWGEISFQANPLLTSLPDFGNTTATAISAGFNDILIDVSGFAGLEEVTNVSLRENAILEDVSFFENFDFSDNIWLRILDNPNLSVCNWTNLCLFLSADPTTKVIIAGNAPGCESVEAVLDTCFAGVADSLLAKDFIITPNPTGASFEIALSAPMQLIGIAIYNLQGQNVLNSDQLTIDVAALAAGVYFVELETDAGRFVKRLIKE